MRTLYLLRHARPLLPAEPPCCLGSRSDVPLSPAGAADAAALKGLFQHLGVSAVGSSPMLRCRRTAELIADSTFPIRLLPGMIEQDCGDWDGRSLRELRCSDPINYALRGTDDSIPPPGGEAPAAAAERGLAALGAFLAATEGDVAVVAHAGINRAILCRLTGTPMAQCRSIAQDYLCINTLHFDGDALTAAAVGQDPRGFL